ncbi:MAG: asparagine synthase (glutamine-hydrolyzing) [Candidatus Riflebacteria bacterium]|nr:asparagine synthase (glutamine-hydrolyzing) [Candidatus Riflebacteria bacterium]
MCGIAGVAGEGAETRADLVARMLETIVHRGPDEGGTRVLPGAVIGNRRLSIIDLAGGRQPIANEDGSIQVVFNGEIYDYRRARELLEARGHRFATHSDTEVLVHRFEEAGERFLDGLNGMWGLALYHVPDRTLYLARDRFGKKPLYWTLRGGLLLFASELKALLVDPAQPRRIDLESLRRYLTFECVPSPATIFEGVNKLPPGTILAFRDGQARIRRYWDVGFLPRETPPTFDEAAQILSAHVDRAVGVRLVADVPIGIFLSGGIDSSTVAQEASRQHPGVKTFTVGFDGRGSSRPGLPWTFCRGWSTPWTNRSATPRSSPRTFSPGSPANRSRWRWAATGATRCSWATPRTSPTGWPGTTAFCRTGGDGCSAGPSTRSRCRWRTSAWISSSAGSSAASTGRRRSATRSGWVRSRPKRAWRCCRTRRGPRWAGPTGWRSSESSWKASR